MRIKIVNSLFYIFAVVGLIINILNILNDESFLGYLVLINTAFLSLSLISSTKFVTFKLTKLNATISIIFKIIFYYLINTILVNENKILIVILIIVSLLISIFDNIIIYKLLKQIKFGSDEFELESRENRLKTIKNSKEFKKFQLNILYYFVGIINVYLFGSLLNLNTLQNQIIYYSISMISLLLSMIYIINFSKYTKLKWYHYFLSIFTMIFIIIIIYLEYNLLVFLTLLPMYPIIIKENEVRKNFLNSNKKSI